MTTCRTLPLLLATAALAAALTGCSAAGETVQPAGFAAAPAESLASTSPTPTPSASASPAELAYDAPIPAASTIFELWVASLDSPTPSFAGAQKARDEVVAVLEACLPNNDFAPKQMPLALAALEKAKTTELDATSTPWDWSDAWGEAMTFGRTFCADLVG
ncbi:hypothetical protein [Mycetocola tolaasinivorans]|uniref:hypothetical protein n=1 Tax=Mycetocola tolaasinivorans TaxID=76635 RepID=UPI0011C3D8E2|nr:hypothetical protein [Mycetocola tolaasinivorans]